MDKLTDQEAEKLMEDVKALVPGRSVCIERIHWYHHGHHAPEERSIRVGVLPGLNGDKSQVFVSHNGPASILDQIRWGIFSGPTPAEAAAKLRAEAAAKIAEAEKLEGRAA